GGILLTLDDERDGKSHKFHYEGGIVSFVTHLNKNKAAVNEKPIYMRGEKDGIDAEIALQWNDGYAETIYSFANNINTHEGGTHLSGFRSALTRTVNYYASKNNLAKDLKESITGDDIREGLTAVISVKIPRPQRAVYRGGRVGRRIGEAGPGSPVSGDPAAQGQDSQRREGARRQDARQRRDQDDDRGARLRDRRGLRHRQDPLPPHHHHDRR